MALQDYRLRQTSPSSPLRVVRVGGGAAAAREEAEEREEEEEEVVLTLRPPLSANAFRGLEKTHKIPCTGFHLQAIRCLAAGA